MTYKFSYVLLKEDYYEVIMGHNGAAKGQKGVMTKCVCVERH